MKCNCVRISEIAILLLTATTAIGAAQGIPAPKPRPMPVEPRQVPESVTSRLLCGSVAAPSRDSKHAQKVGVERKDQGNTFCGQTPRAFYPEAARRKGIQGTVILEAVIGKDGVIRHLRVLQGHPLLADAALDAVKQWKYKPYLEQGKPVEVKTTVKVNFTLQGTAQPK